MSISPMEASGLLAQQHYERLLNYRYRVMLITHEQSECCTAPFFERSGQDSESLFRNKRWQVSTPRHAIVFDKYRRTGCRDTYVRPVGGNDH